MMSTLADDAQRFHIGRDDVRRPAEAILAERKTHLVKRGNEVLPLVREPEAAPPPSQLPPPIVEP